MSIYLVLESIINEATTQEIYDKYYNDIDYNVFIKIISSDPRTNLQKNKIGAYSKVLLNIYRKNNLRLEDLPKATEYLDILYKRNIPVNINQIDDLSDIYLLVQKYIAQESGKLSSILPALNTNEYKKLMDGNKWIIYKPITEKAACYLGVGTEWCTQWGKLSLNPKHRDRTNQFRRYNNDTLYIIINKTNESEKYQFHFPSNQFKNSSDRDINASYFFESEPEIKQFFFPSLFSDNLLPTDEEISRIENLDEDDMFILMKKKFGDVSNKLVIAYITKNEEELSKLINTEEPSLIDDGKIEFSFDKLIGDINYLHRLYRYFNSSLQNYEYESNIESDTLNSLKNDYFLNYYQKNKDNLSKIYKIFDYQTFKILYLEQYLSDDRIDSEIIDKYEESEKQSHDAAIESAIKKIHNYIRFVSTYSYISVDVKAVYYLKFLIDNNIERIENQIEILNKYISYYDIGTDYEAYDIDYHGDLPEYSDVKVLIEDIFDELLEKDNETDCRKLKEQFTNIIEKQFKSKYSIQNEIAYVKIYPETFDCQNESVKIDFRNKKTNEKFSGNVKIDNINSYINNYKLFEFYINFKRLI